MIAIRDLNTHIEEYDMSYDGVVVGVIHAQYEVGRYVDTKNLISREAYIIECTLRACIQPEFAYELKPRSASNYERYPALLKTSAKIIGYQDKFDLHLISYDPKTLNSSIERGQTTSNSAGTEVTREHTKTDSRSHGHSFTLGASGGYQATPVGMLSFDWNWYQGREHSQSNSNGSSKQRSTESSGSASMSIKDWGSYASVDPTSKFVSWIWGQEYPWNILQYNALDENDGIVLPQFVRALLTESPYIHPPSDLSLFGIDFTSKSSWMLYKNDDNRSDDFIQFQHDIDYTVASHGLKSSSASSELSGADSEPFAVLNNYGALKLTSQPVDLCRLALAPLPSGIAVIGFRKPQLRKLIANTSSGRIISDNNDLLVDIQGFSQGFESRVNDTQKSSIVVQFKLADDRASATLQIRHWIAGAGACRLKISINGNQLPDKYATDPFDANGEQNLLLVTLRHQDFSSQNYCDYLVPGINLVNIEFDSPSDTPCVYTLDALGVS